MRTYLRAKSIFMLVTLFLGLVAPLAATGAAEAQRSNASQVRRHPQQHRSATRHRNSNHANRSRHQAARQTRPNRPNAHRPNTHRPNSRHRNMSRHRNARNTHRRPHHSRNDRHRNHRSHRVVVVHPRRHWHPGGAIAAGAAIGFIAGASAVSWAGQPPHSGWCWFYTTPQRTRGFWDVCPRRMR